MDEQIIKSVAENGCVKKEISSFILETTAGKLIRKIYLLVYKHHEVQIGIIENGQIQIERPEELATDYLKELRAFSKNGELYIWKQNQELRYRLRIDGEGETFRIYEEDHFMWGSNIKNQGRTVYEQDRGMTIHLPFSVSEVHLPLKYRVRNYYDYDANGLIRFSDARLVCFLDTNGKEI